MVTLGPRRKYLAIFLGDDPKGYDFRFVQPHRLEGTKLRVRGIRYKKFTYAFKPTKAFRLENMNTWDPDSRLSPMLDLIWPYVSDTLVLFYTVGDPEPMDKCRIGISENVNPRLLRVFTNSKLFNDYLRKLNYGSVVSTKTLLIMLGAFALLFVVLYFGGYV